MSIQGPVGSQESLGSPKGGFSNKSEFQRDIKDATRPISSAARVRHGDPCTVPADEL